MTLMYCVAQTTYESLSNEAGVYADSYTTHLDLRRELVWRSDIISQACWDWEVLHRYDRSLYNLQRR